MGKYITEAETLDNLKSKMRPENALEFDSYKHLKIEAGFYDRVFIIYQPRGSRHGQDITQQKEPKVLSIVRVVGFTADLQHGAQARLFDETSGSEMSVGYVPKKLFNYPIYVSIPAELKLTLSGQKTGKTVRDSFTFAILIKCQDKADQYTTTNTYMETPAKFKVLFPALVEQFKF